MPREPTGKAAHGTDLRRSAARWSAEQSGSPESGLPLCHPKDRSISVDVAGMRLLPECRETIRAGALVAVSISGGKDCRAMTILLSHIVPRDRLVAVHAPLGEVEWHATLVHIRATLPDGVALILAPVECEESLLDNIEERARFQASAAASRPVRANTASRSEIWATAQSTAAAAGDAGDIATFAPAAGCASTAAPALRTAPFSGARRRVLRLARQRHGPRARRSRTSRPGSVHAPEAPGPRRRCRGS